MVNRPFSGTPGSATNTGRYVIQLSSAAAKQLKKLDLPVGKKIFADIQNLAGNPRPHGYEQLTGKGKLYRLPVGPGKTGMRPGLVEQAELELDRTVGFGFYTSFFG